MFSWCHCKRSSTPNALTLTSTLTFEAIIIYLLQSHNPIHRDNGSGCESMTIPFIAVVGIDELEPIVLNKIWMKQAFSSASGLPE